MLSYQHGFHAGCLADVVKHITLTHTLKYLTLKEKPLFYLDTHSGRGLYDLQSPQSLKTQEFKYGISALWTLRNKLPPVFTDYLEAIAQWNDKNSLRYYPGSPALAIAELRSQDRLYFCERHPKEFESLNAFIKPFPKVFCIQADGYAQMLALLPPAEKRGCIMIDPSYEVKDEYRDVMAAVQKAYRRFETGTYLIWYPILDKKLHQKLLNGFASISCSKKLRIEFYLNSKNTTGMDAFGLAVLNPPFTLKEKMHQVCDFLIQNFNKGASCYTMQSDDR